MTNRTLNITLGVALAGVAAVAGCGGSGGGSCGLQPCGGDIVANWSISELCLAPGAVDQMVPADLMASCPQASITPVMIEPTGSFVANSNMTYTFDLTLTGGADMIIPTSCLSGATCPVLNAAIALQLAQMPIAGIQSITCTGSSSCTCTIAITPETVAESGTYTTSGNSLTTTPAGGVASSPNEYCVQGNTLVLRQAPTGTGGMMDTVMAIVATK